MVEEAPEDDLLPITVLSDTGTFLTKALLPLEVTVQDAVDILCVQINEEYNQELDPRVMMLMTRETPGLVRNEMLAHYRQSVGDVLEVTLRSSIGRMDFVPPSGLRGDQPPVFVGGPPISSSTVSSVALIKTLIQRVAFNKVKVSVLKLTPKEKVIVQKGWGGLLPLLESLDHVFRVESGVVSMVRRGKKWWVNYFEEKIRKAAPSLGADVLVAVLLQEPVGVATQFSLHKFGKLQEFLRLYPLSFSVSSGPGPARVSLISEDVRHAADVAQFDSVIRVLRSTRRSMKWGQLKQELERTHGQTVTVKLVQRLRADSRFAVVGKKKQAMISLSSSTHARLAKAPKEKSTRSSTPTPFGAKIISTPEECQRVCALLATDKLLAIDCEGVNLGAPGGSLCLIQVASENAGVFLFDVVQCDLLFDCGLRSLLESDTVLKFIHDCRHDAAALFSCAKVVLNRVFDSQVAYSVINKTHTRISLDNLIRNTIGKQHPEKKNAPHKRDHRIWAKRPLSSQCISYAAADVVLLLEAGQHMLTMFANDHDMARVQQTSLARIKEATSRMEANEKREQGAASTSAAAIETLIAASSDEKVLPYQVELMSQFDVFLNALPDEISSAMLECVDGDPELCVVDVIMDLFRPVRVIRNNGKSIYLRDCIVSEDDINYVLDHCGEITDANRCCVGESLHRCSVIRDGQQAHIVGLTMRMARVVSGIASTVEEILVSGKSLLLVGAPGRGKTTLLRDIARVLASEEHDRRVMIVDTNNEIAGEHTLPHAAIGNARRLKVGARSRQHRVMLEAVQNHTPEVLIIDEIGTLQEAREAVGVRQRGVQLIATTHGETIAEVIQSPSLNVLLGGMNVVILSAGEKEMEGAAAKTRRERRTPPAFDVCIELLDLRTWRVHYDVAQVVDCILRGMDEVVSCEMRRIEKDYVRVTTEPFPDLETKASVEFSTNEECSSDMD